MERGKKSHDGTCAWTFMKYTKGKCKKCGYRMQGKYYCAYPDCGRTKTVNHLCLGD